MCTELFCVVVSLLCVRAGLIVACAWLWDAYGYGMGCMLVWDGMHVGMEMDCQTELPVLTKTSPTSHPFTYYRILLGPSSMLGTNVLVRAAHCHDNGGVITKFD